MDFDFDQNIYPFNIDLNNLEREYFARDIRIEEQRERSIQLDTNLQEIFPDADESYMKMKKPKLGNNSILLQVELEKKLPILGSKTKIKFLNKLKMITFLPNYNFLMEV